MEFDPIVRLTKRIGELKKSKEALEKRHEEDKISLVTMKDRLEKIKEELQKKKGATGSGVLKMAHIEKVVSGTEAQLRRLVLTSLAIEKTLDGIVNKE